MFLCKFNCFIKNFLTIISKSKNKSCINSYSIAMNFIGKFIYFTLFRFTVKHSLIFCAFVGLLTVLQAYVLPWSLHFFQK